MIICPTCTSENRDGAAFCNNCGTSLASTQACPACGTSNSPQARFCSQCATPLRGISPQGGLLTGLLQPSTILQNRYIIVRRVGQGGMGAVYEAADARITGKLWAVKEMSDAALSQPLEKQQAIDAFCQEAQMLAALSHPNLPVVSDFFSEGGKQYLVMEYVGGETLEERLKGTSGFLDESEVLEWADQICDVLTYLHKRNPPVVFRDLKPGNIMVDRQGRVKLIDFGIARLFKPGKAGDTQAMGTPGYAAPEQYGKGQTDARSDVFSLGVTLHQLLTGYDPADTPFNLPPAHRINTSVSISVADAIDKATQSNPNSRFQTVEDMRRALKAPSPKPVSPASKPVSPPPRVIATSKSAPVAAAAAAQAIPKTSASASPRPSPAKATAVPAKQPSFWRDLVKMLVVAGVFGVASLVVPEYSTGILIGAGVLGAVLIRRRGTALLMPFLVGLVTGLLRGHFIWESMAVFGCAGIGMELVFLLGGYRKFTFWAVLIGSLMGTVGVLIGVWVIYEDFLWHAFGEWVQHALVAGGLMYYLDKAMRTIRGTG